MAGRGRSRKIGDARRVGRRGRNEAAERGGWTFFAEGLYLPALQYSPSRKSVHNYSPSPIFVPAPTALPRFLSNRQSVFRRRWEMRSRHRIRGPPRRLQEAAMRANRQRPCGLACCGGGGALVARGHSRRLRDGDPAGRASARDEPWRTTFRHHTRPQQTKCRAMQSFPSPSGIVGHTMVTLFIC